MTYWIPDEKSSDGYAYEKWTAEDEKLDPDHKEGEDKIVDGQKVRAIREKQFSDINWIPCIEGKFFNIQTVAGQTEDQWRANLVKALSTVLHPLNEVLNFLLNSGTLDIYGLANLRGADGYENAVYPLLQVLGCTKERNELKTPAEYKAEAQTDPNNLIYNILNPVFSRLNNILRGSKATGEAIGPVRAVLNLLPGLALFVEQGGVQKLVEELIYPIGNIADTIIGVLSKDNSKLFDVVFDALLAADTLEPLHTNKGFEGTGITERIIEKLIVAVFNAPTKTKEDGTIDDTVTQWANVHKHVYEIVAGFVKANEDASNVYLTTNKDGQLEINNISLTLAEQKDETGAVTRPEKKVTLPAIRISSLNDLLADLAKLGAPIPWGTAPNNDGMNATAVQRRTDAFVILWNFIWGIVENNRGTNDAIPTLINDFVKPLLGDETFDLMGKYINKILLDRTAEDVLSAFIAVTKALNSSAFDKQTDWDAYFAKSVSLTPVKYPIKNIGEGSNPDELYTAEDVNSVIHTISGIAQSVLSAVTGNTIADLSVDLLYNDKLIATISQAIFGLADNQIVKAFLPLLGVNGLSIDGIAAKLTEYGYAELATAVSALKGGVGKEDGKLSDLEWFVQATGTDGKPLFEEDGTTPVMVPSELAKKWYITDDTGFINYVWKTPGAYNNPNITEAEIDANYRFTRAIVVALSPFSSLINTLFNARTSTIFGEIQLTGAKGYRNAVKPLLQALGADPMSVNDFNAYIDGGKLDNNTVISKGNQDFVIYNILNPILSKVDAIIHNPGAQLFSTIATFGAFIGDDSAVVEGKGNLQTAIEYLLKPILDMVDPIVRLADDNDDLFTIIFNILGIYHHDKDGKNETLVTWDNIHQHLFDVVAHFLGFDDKNPDKLYMATLDKQLIVNNITINGKKYSLTVPEYDLSKLRNCTVDSEMEKRASDAFVTVFRYIRSILNANSIQKHSDGSYVGDGDTYKLDDNAFIPSLVNDLLNNADLYATIKPYLQNVLGSQEDEILITVIRLFENLDQSALLSDVTEIAKDWAEQLKLSGTTADVNYGGVTLDEVSNAIDTLRTSVHNALNAYTNIKIDSFTADYIYQNSIINMLASVIFPLGDNATVAALLKILHIDVTRDHIVKQLVKYGYDELAAKISAVGDKENLGDLAWTVQDTEKNEDGSVKTDAEGKPVLKVDENGDPVMVANPELADLWYVHSYDEFKTNVWDDAPFRNPLITNEASQLTDQYRFTRALVVVLSPFTELIGVLTQAKSAVIFEDPNRNPDGSPMDGHGDVVLKGEYGYSNAIKPLMEALGIDAMDGQTYRDMAKTNPDYIIYNIVNPILSRIDTILDMPIRSLLETLPTLAQYLGNGGLQKSITNLLYPITKIASPVIRLLTGEVRSEKEVKPEKFYDIVIKLVANIADIDVLKNAEADGLWETIHEWDKLISLVDGILDMVGAKTDVAVFDGHFVKVAPVIEKDANGKDVIKGYEYKYTVKDADGKDAEQTKTYSVAEVEKVLGIEINGIVYQIDLEKLAKAKDLSPFDRLGRCQFVKAETTDAIAAAEKALQDAQAAGSDADTIKGLEDALAAAKAVPDMEVKANTLLCFIQYICDVVEFLEPDFINPLLTNVLGSNYDTFSEYINNVLTKVNDTPEDISTALVKLLNATDSSSHIAKGWDILEKNLTPTEVTYPSSYSRDDVNTAIQTLSDIVTGVLENLLETSITQLTTDKIYTNEVVNTLAKAIYTATAGMASTLKLAGIDVSKENFVKLLNDYGYTDIANEVDNATEPGENQTWADTTLWNYLDWKLDNKSENFAHAIAAVLAPFDTLISALLCAGKVDVASVITITGANGYKNAIKPLLDELGFAPIEDEDNPTLEAIIKVILAKLDDIVKDKNLVGKVVDFLPGLANFVTNGGVQKFIEELIYPLTNLINPILKLVTDKNIFNFAIEILDKLEVIDLTAYDWNEVHKELFTIIESFINVNYTVVDGKKIALSKDDNGYFYTVDNKKQYVKNPDKMTGIAINGTAYPLNIPKNITGMTTDDIFATIAGCAVFADGSDKADTEVRPDTLVTALRYVWDVVQANKEDLIKPLLKDLLKETYDDKDVQRYIKNILDVTDADEFIDALIEILTNLSKLDCDIQWNLYDGYKQNKVTYPIKGIKDITAEVTAKDVEYVIDTLSDVVAGVLPMILKNDKGEAYTSLNAFVSDKLYTDSLVNTLAKALLPLGEDDTVAKVLSIFGMSFDTFYQAVVDGKIDTNVLVERNKVHSYKEVDWSQVTWNVTDSASLVDALANLLSPFNPALSFLLNGAGLEIADGALTIPGDKGYVNAVKPLLDVLGCTTVSKADYEAAAAADANNLLANILNPLLNRVDEILTAPVDEVIGIVPALANFINEGALQTVVEELLHPITNIINPVIRLAYRNEDGSMKAKANIFDIVFSILKAKIGAPKDATWSTVQDYIFDIVNHFVPAEIEINKVKYPLTIPSGIDKKTNIIEALAGCGTVTGDKLVGNKADTLVTVLRYVWAVVEDNEKDFVTPLLKNLLKANEEGSIYGKVEKYLTELFKSNADQVIVALVEALKGFNKDGRDASAEWKTLLEKTPVEVKYPNGLTVKDVKDALYQLTDIVNAVLPMVLKSTGYDSLKALVGDKLYTKSLVESIAKALNGLGYEKDENGNTVESSLNKTLKDVAGIDFTAVPTVVGEVKNGATFAAELAKVLAPLNGIVNAILNGGKLEIAGIVTIEGENAYVNAVKPLLEVLGCNTITLDAMDGSASIEGILKVALARVDEILDSTNLVADILEMVPEIANFIAKGGLQKFVEELIYPVLRIVNPIADLLGAGNIFNVVLGVLGIDGIAWNDVQNNIFELIATFLKANDKKDNVYAEVVKSGIFNRTKSLVIHNINLGDIDGNGKDDIININVPEFDLAKLAGADDGKGNTAENTLVTALRYVWAVVDANEDTLVGVLKGVLKDNYSKVEKYITRLFKNSDDNVVVALVNTLNALDSALDRSDAWKEIRAAVTEKPVNYPADVLSRAEVTALIDRVTGIVNKALPKLLPSIMEGKNYTSLQDLVAGELYTKNLVETIANALHGLGYDENGNVSGLNNTLKDLVGIDFTAVPTGDKLGTVNSKETFIDALAKVLAPFDPVVNALLKGDDLEVAGIAIGGENGYVYAIKPLLQVLGCKDLEATVNDSAPTLKAIITAVLNRVDEILADPITEVLEMLPQLANFVDKGGIQTFVEELIYPVIRIATPVVSLVKDDKQNLFDFVLEIVSEFVPEVNNYLPKGTTWSNIHKKLNDFIAKFVPAEIEINGVKYPINIPKIDLSEIAGCGTGTGIAFNPEKADVFTKLVGYIFKVVKENKDNFFVPIIKDLLGDGFDEEIIDQVINEIFETDEFDLIAALADIVNGLDTDTAHKADWSKVAALVTPTVVNYPENGKAEVESFISTVSGLVNTLVPGLIKDANGNGYDSLTALVNEKLYTKSLVETIAKALRGVGVNADGTVKDINNTLKDIVGIDFTKVPTTIGEVKDSASFAKELAKVFAPFDHIVDALLNAGSLDIYGIVEIGGQNAYVDAIKPLLTVLGCDTSSIVEGKATLEAILTVLLARVDEIVADPVNEVLALIPAIANFIDKGGIQTFVEELLYPVERIISPILPMDEVYNMLIAFVAGMFGLPEDATWENIQDYIFDIVNTLIPEVAYIKSTDKDGNVTYKILKLDEDENSVHCGEYYYETTDKNGKVVRTYLKNEDYKDVDYINGFVINGVPYPFYLNGSNLLKNLGGCGVGGGFDLAADKADTFVTLFGFVWDVVKANEEKLVRPLLKNLIGDNETINNVVDRLLGLSKEEVVLTIIKLFNGLKSDGHVADWSKIEAAINTTKVKYPAGVTAKDIDNLLNTVSNIVDTVVPMLLKSTGYKSLQALVAGKLYTPDLINTIAKALKGLAENKQITDILAYVGITMNPADYDKTWNVKDANSFAKALAELVEPFNVVIDALLNGGSIVVAEGILGENAITIEGENGYINAIKPLLTVLGCNTNGIKDGHATVEAILKSLLGRVNEILANPVDEIVALVPQLVNFINKGGIQTFVEELVYPVTRIAAPVSALLDEDGDLFSFIFNIVKDLDAVKAYIPAKATWDNIQNYIFDILAKIDINIPINGKNYKLRIPALDLNALGGCGTGNGFEYNANKADTIIIVLRYVWNVVQTNKNSFIIPMLKSVLGNNYKNFGEYIEKALANEDDTVIKAIVDVFKGLDASAHKADWSFLYKNYKSANVKYPNGVTAKDLEQVVEILSVAVNNALEIFLGKSLDDLVPGMIYTDSLVNTIAKAIGSLKNNKDLKDIFALLGVDFSKVNYNQKWHVTDKRSFAKAIATILSPFNNLLAVLLNAGEFNLEGIIELRGANGYENAIKPLLDVLGCKTVSASKYKSDALKNSNNLLLNILNPLLNRVDVILANPIEEVLDLLPSIANFINKGGIQKFVEELIYPVTNLVSPIVKLVTNDNVFDFALKLLNKLGVLDVNLSWKNLQNQIIPLVNTFLTNIKINGKSYKITVPNINWATMAGCGKVRGNAIAANDGDVLLTLLRYVFKALDANKNILFDLVGGKNSTIGQIVNNVLKQGADGMARIVVRILLKLETFDNVKWTFKNIKEIKVKYTEHLGEKEYFEAIGKLDAMIAELLDQFVHISLESVLGDLVYTNNIINTLAKLIYTNIEKVDIGIDLNTVLKVVDLDVSTGGVASILRDYSSASREIGRHAKWSQGNFDSLNWGFKDGNRDGFVNALSAILRPVQPILRVILSGEDLIVLGSIQIKGGNGYNTAIIPLLEALGVNPSKLVSPQQYAREASTDKVLTNILNPLLDKVEELTHGPIDALTKMLPNIAYFVYNGGVQAIAENLIAPVTNILHEIDPIYSLNLDLSMLGDVDLAGLVNGILSGIKINGQPLGIVLPDIDLATLAGLGKLVTYRSARTYFGKQMDCKKVNADQAAVFISVLRYLIKTLQQNLDNIKKLLEGLGLSGDIADMIAQVLEMLTNMDVDGVIEALMELLFGYDIGNGGKGPNSESEKNGLAFGDFSWLYQAYWVIFAITVLIMIYFLYLLFSKKNDDDENPENPEGPNPPEAPSEEQETYKDNNKQGDMI